ncbi:DUF1302 domain-containing protein [Thauera linaloolentis]|uniref:DUF1302 domain-containing protein n=1 Tax=Thauera linaloolentis (strain DSM 12138 / JCM 21573 / CCUG 41526 / CIP 105981 / IAM 15112 / NBRC 102519 / 47Lol) TaxID=1123367 RepID=N6Z065_THAL4|nr:DUF1302 domain-containing protein [Thauera linaloolentis]ENO87798.1 hypothetical protein C666_10135 [Thauera linaloolentis 47Lol = DSM 12138]MCM8565279.1 DUF1302 domain-containing protein [Thauera linaloolentis]
MKEKKKMPCRAADGLRRPVRSRLVTAGLLAAAAGSGLAPGAAHAGSFSLDNGIEGNWGLNVSLGTSIRTSNADADLIMTGNGGRGGSSHDDGNLNYRKKGDVFSTIAKATGELSLTKDNVGVFLRAKAWHDFETSRSGVRHGHSANGFEPGARLDDGEFDRLSRFSGFELLDAYVFANTQLGDDNPLTIKLGNHVVNWGESLFTPGINAYGAFDLSAARRPGTQVKEVLLPIPQLSANLGLTENLSVEGFYQLRWRKNVLDGCGTYWSISDVYNCADAGVNVPAGPLGAFTDQQVYEGIPVSAGPLGAGTTGVLGNAGNIDPSDSGQWGIAARYFSPGLSTEFGVYYVNYHQRSPVISVLLDPSPLPSAFAGGNRTPPLPTFGMQYAWDWSGEDIKAFGLSFSTTLSGWSVFGEVSHTRDIPVQLNGLDLLRGASNGAGPLGFLAGVPRGEGTLFTGHELKDKTQLQLNTLKIFPRVMGAESVSVLGEVVYQRWSGIGDADSGRRYGRAFVFGQAAHGGSGLACADTGNADAKYCENEGFATTSAWGYRLQATFSYPGVFAGVNFKPRVFWSHDVKGYAADNLFVEDRKILGLGAGFDYLNKYYLDISYNRFNRGARYDTFRDRDFASVVVGMNF